MGFPCSRQPPNPPRDNANGHRKPINKHFAEAQKHHSNNLTYLIFLKICGL